MRALRGEAVNARRPRERAGEAPAQRIDGVEHSVTIIRVMAGMCPERTNNLIAQLTALQDRQDLHQKDGEDALGEEFDLARTLIEARTAGACRNRNWRGG